MEIVKNLLAAIGLMAIIFGFYILFKPKEITELDTLHKQNDSLFAQIEKTNQFVDSMEKVNDVLDSQKVVLVSKMGDLNKKTKKLKEQHEKDIERINAMSDNDVTDLFSDKFTDIE